VLIEIVNSTDKNRAHDDATHLRRAGFKTVPVSFRAFGTSKASTLAATLSSLVIRRDNEGDPFCRRDRSLSIASVIPADGRIRQRESSVNEDSSNLRRLGEGARIHEETTELRKANCELFRVPRNECSGTRAGRIDACTRTARQRS